MKDIVLNELAFNFLDFSYPNEYTIEHTEPNKIFGFTYIKSGKVKITTDKVTIIAEQGEMVFNPPHLAYSRCYCAEEGTTGININFRYWPDVNDYEYPIQKLTVDPTLMELISSLPNQTDKVDSRFIWHAYQFLDVVQNYMKKNDSKNTKKIQKAIAFMRENDNYTIPDLARMCNMSECRFYVVFNDIVGMTPVKMKHKIQTSKAELLLETTTLSIDEIAHKVGFESTAHFRKIFNQRFGYSPKEARKRSFIYDFA